MVFAKAKVSPAKTKTIPTMELLAIFLSIKCLEVFLSNLSLKCVTVYSDSKVALSWVKSKMNTAKEKSLRILKVSFMELF